MRSALLVWSLLALLSFALVSCAKRDTAATPGNPAGAPGAAQPPTTQGPGLISTSSLQGSWSTGCVADDSGSPVVYALAIQGTSMRYTKETFSSWDCMGPGYPTVDETLTFELRRVSDDPSDYHVMVYDGDETFYDWVRYYQSATPALEFIASDYTATGSYRHRYYKR